MAKLTPDATRTEHGLVINEKIIPWGAVWPKDSGAYKKGAQYKADRLLSGGTGKVKGVTIHNTNDLKNVEAHRWRSIMTCPFFWTSRRRPSAAGSYPATERNGDSAFLSGGFRWRPPIFRKLPQWRAVRCG